MFARIGFSLGGLVFRACLCSYSCAACVCVARFVLSLLLALFGAFYDRTCVVHGLAETGVGVVFHCVCVCLFLTPPTFNDCLIRAGHVGHCQHVVPGVSKTLS